MSGESRRNPVPQSRQPRKPYAGRNVLEQKQPAAVKMTPLTKRVGKKLRVLSVRSGLDMPSLFLVLVLVVIGPVMLFSASYTYTYYNYGSSYYFIIRQVAFAILGMILMLLILYFDYHHLHRFAIPLLLVSYAFLVIVLFLPAVKGVHRWINLGLLGFQPSKIAKFAMTLCFAHPISINFKRMDTARHDVLPYVFLLAVMVLLLIREPRMSAAVIIIALAGVMLFIGGVPLRWLGATFGVALVGIAYLVLFTSEFSYINDRVVAWPDPFTAGKNLPVGTRQTRQPLYAIDSGGLLGPGLGQSRQKYLCLLGPQNDFIFAIVCEELELIGALITVILFALLVWCGVTISLEAKDKFGILLGIGLTLQVGLQVVLNITATTNAIPNISINLPFFSYGGTSLVLLLAQMGVVPSISRTSAIEKT